MSIVPLREDTPEPLRDRLRYPGRTTGMLRNLVLKQYFDLGHLGWEVVCCCWKRNISDRGQRDGPLPWTIRCARSVAPERNHRWNICTSEVGHRPRRVYVGQQRMPVVGTLL